MTKHVCGLLFTVLGTLSWAAEPPTALVVSAKGAVSLRRGSKVAGLRAYSGLRAGDKVSVAPGASLTYFVYANETIVSVPGGMNIAVDSKGIHVKGKGKVSARKKPGFGFALPVSDEGALVIHRGNNDFKNVHISVKSPTSVLRALPTTLELEIGPNAKEDESFPVVVEQSMGVPGHFDKRLPGEVVFRAIASAKQTSIAIPDGTLKKGYLYSIRVEQTIDQAPVSLQSWFSILSEAELAKVKEAEAMAAQESAEDLTFLGLLYFRVGLFSDAERAFNRVLALSPENDGAAIMLARIREASRR